MWAHWLLVPWFWPWFRSFALFWSTLTTKQEVRLDIHMSNYLLSSYFIVWQKFERFKSQCHGVTQTRFAFFSTEAQNPVARFIMCCLKCCFWCLEKFIKFLNRNAYIMVSSAGCRGHVGLFLLLVYFISVATVELECSLSPEWCNVISKVTTSFVFVLFFSFPDRHLREKLLRLGQKCFQAAHEKRFEVSGSCFLLFIHFLSIIQELTPCLSLLTVNTTVWIWELSLAVAPTLQGCGAGQGDRPAVVVWEAAGGRWSG